MSDKGESEYIEGRRRRSRRRKRLCLGGALLLIIFVAGLISVNNIEQVPELTKEYQEAMQKFASVWSGTASRSIREELDDMLEKNTETADFVSGYQERDNYINQPIDLSEDFEPGTVPLLLQWDKRWGYDSYGDSIIGLSGCGPTCLSMAYLYFTEDTTENPRTMAEFAGENGFYTEGGTSWSLWTEGAALLGLSGEELPLDENLMKRALDKDGLIVCSMRPGDFTTTGHFILIRGYDENGFIVNDPNRRAHSQRQWSYEELSGQIKNLWVLAEK